MRHIFTVSIDTELEKQLDEHQKNMKYETRSEGAIQLMKKGLTHDEEIESLRKRIKELESMQKQIHLPCSVCGKPMSIQESNADPIYMDIRKKYANWGHSSCVDSENRKDG